MKFDCKVTIVPNNFKPTKMNTGNKDNPNYVEAQSGSVFFGDSAVDCYADLKLDFSKYILKPVEVLANVQTYRSGGQKVFIKEILNHTKA